MASRNTASFEWDIAGSPYASELLTETRQFGTANPCFLVDQYSGRRPALINQEFIATGKLEFRLYASALLDSNLADQLQAIVNGGTVRDGFKALLDHLTREGWDFSLQFYCIEHFCKARSLDEFKSNAVARTRALLALHSMDGQEYLATGRIVPFPEAVEHYLRIAGCRSLDEVARQRIDEFCTKFSRAQALEHIEAIEIALIKMVLLRRFEMRKARPLEQHAAFLDFLERDLDAVLAREAHLALHYFYDKAGSLLGIQPNTPFARALDNIRSTAWDMYFLRFPEMFFSGSPTELCLSYIATQEKQLAELARLSSVERIIGDPECGYLPVIGYSVAGLPEEAMDARTPSRPPRTGRRAIPAGFKDAMVNELRRRLPS